MPISQPLSIYINWSTYDELSDQVELTETIAMHQLKELLRWRKLGARMDYYLMDCFWYARDGGYRTWRKPHWPDGPTRFLECCLENEVKPGLWLSANNLMPMVKLDLLPAWRDSYDPLRQALCFFQGGYLAHLLESMDLWYQAGVRAFKFDFLNLGAVPPGFERCMLPSEIRAANTQALRKGLIEFRRLHPEVLLLGYNGFEEADTFSRTDAPVRRTVDPAWLETFDSLYCGDPRPADVPAMNFWRSKDVYSDHMVRYFNETGFPFHRIDNAGFMIGTTGTCYYRGAEAWKGMLLLSLARGGWGNTYYGNLDLLDDEAVRWFAKAQRLYYPLQQAQKVQSFGSMPGTGTCYGFIGKDDQGAVFAVVNPSQTVENVNLPTDLPGLVLFHDAGFLPSLEGQSILLGPEQMALVGTGHYANPDFDLGVQEDVHIPTRIVPVNIPFEVGQDGILRARLAAPQEGTLRVILRQAHPNGLACRSTGGSPPFGQTLGQILKIRASQSGQELPIHINYDKAIWSGLSWAVAEIEPRLPGNDLWIECSSSERSSHQLRADLYKVERE